jgi:CheY-like chemotaxis protein
VRILFVDDEPLLVRALRNLLHPQRGAWSMTFVTSGAAALEELGKGHFDVIVSDLRMPGMDGVALLEVVRDLYPRVKRIVLSGHAEPASLEAARRLAHCMLAKPCSVGSLKDAITDG